MGVSSLGVAMVATSFLVIYDGYARFPVRLQVVAPVMVIG